jgi:hypothetical protein
LIVGTDNLIASSTDPLGGDWDVVRVGEGEAPEIPESAPVISGNQIQGISCPDPQMCVAVNAEGFVYSTHDPGGPAASWKSVSVDGPGRNTHLLGVSCPSASLCVATGELKPKQTWIGERPPPVAVILSSEDPDGPATAWRTVELGPSLELRGVSCPSPSLCVAVSKQGTILTSTEPSGEASAWKLNGPLSGPRSLQAISCVGSLLCLTGNEVGELLTSSAPLAGIGSWSSARTGVAVRITGSECLSTSQCLAVSDNGDVIASTDPSAGDWAVSKVSPYEEPDTPTGLEGNGLFSASCASADLCIATGALGQIFSSSEPFSSVGQSQAEGKLRRRRVPRARIARIVSPYRRHYRHGRGTAVARFYARGGARGFRCRIDKRRFRPCRSPKRYRLKVGLHIFRVRAIGAGGVEGPIAHRMVAVGRCDVDEGHRSCHRLSRPRIVG